MKRILLIATLVLTVVMFAVGHAVSYLVTIVALSLDLPGPYSTSPIAWIWFVLSAIFLFCVSFIFCRWIASKIEKLTKAKNTIE